jgi:hypothetical protein
MHNLGDKKVLHTGKHFYCYILLLLNVGFFSEYLPRCKLFFIFGCNLKGFAPENKNPGEILRAWLFSETLTTGCKAGATYLHTSLFSFLLQFRIGLQFVRKKLSNCSMHTFFCLLLVQRM